MSKLPLTAAQIARLKPGPKPKRIRADLGLYIDLHPDGSRAWVARLWMPDGKERSLGLGRLAEVSLDDARQSAAEARQLARQGIDPVAHRKAARAAAAGAATSFGELADRYVSKRRHEWSTKHADQWAATLRSPELTAFRALRIADITRRDVVAVLEQFAGRPETGRRIRGRIEAVLRYAEAADLRPENSNPALQRLVVDLVPTLKKSRRTVRSFRALDWRVMPQFWRELLSQDGIGAVALRFAILTAARTGEVLGATWPEIDPTSNTWRIPAERMKAGRPHVVPLSDAALVELRAMVPLRRDDRAGFIFPSLLKHSTSGLSNMSLLAVLRRMGWASRTTSHGMRSAFRTWCAERTEYPRELAELALAHALPSAVEAAYMRGSAIERRRQLMSDWAAFLAEGSATAVSEERTERTGVLRDPAARAG